MYRSFAFVLASVLLTSCASVPTTYDFDSKRTYSNHKDFVWEAVMNFFAKNNIQIRTIEKASGLIYAETEYTRDGVKNLADCGSYILEVAGPASAQFNVFVTAEPEGKPTTVTVTTKFRQLWTFGGNENVRPCNSKGRLEREIFDNILAYLQVQYEQYQLRKQKRQRYQ